jgi:rhamnulokinase
MNKNMKQSFFAVDLGATSGRTILGTFTSNGLELEVINRFPNNLIQVDTRFYWDIYELYRHILEGLKLVARREDTEILSVGIDTWGVDFVCIGSDGALLRLPRAYRDPHTIGAPEAFFERIPRSKVYGLTGIQVMNFNSLFQLDAMRRNRDSALTAASGILFMPDALSYLLTGEMVTEYTIASTSQMLNAFTRRLEPELLHAVGLTEKNFGRFVEPGTRIGVLSGEIQSLTGLGAVPVIAVAGHDTASAVAAVPALDKQFAYLSSGTWSLMGIEAGAPVITEETETLNMTNEGGVSGTIRLLKNICGMWLLERCRADWEECDYAGLIAEAQAEAPFRSLINPDDPAFANPACMEQAIRAYCAEHHQPVPATRGQVVRCIFESLSLRYRQVLESLRSLSPQPIKVLHVIGGGSRNELLNQWTANALGIPVVAGPAEATAIGNVMIQALAAGAATDIASMRRLINRSVPLKTYFPAEDESWNAAYRKFEEVTKEE